jgi:hypothetical protein
MEVTVSAKAEEARVHVTVAWRNGSKEMSRSNIVVLVADLARPKR